MGYAEAIIWAREIMGGNSVLGAGTSWLLPVIKNRKANQKAREQVRAAKTIWGGGGGWDPRASSSRGVDFLRAFFTLTRSLLTS